MAIGNIGIFVVIHCLVESVSGDSRDRVLGLITLVPSSHPLFQKCRTSTYETPI